MSGQGPSSLQSTPERAAWVLPAEQLPPPLPDPALLAAQIQGSCGSAQGVRAWGTAAEAVWRERACLRLRITGEHPPPPCVKCCCGTLPSASQKRSREKLVLKLSKAVASPH